MIIYHYVKNQQQYKHAHGNTKVLSDLNSSEGASDSVKPHDHTYMVNLNKY